MKRRELIKLFASLPAAWPLFTHGQQIGKVAGRPQSARCCVAG